MTREMPEPCQFPSLASCQKRFLWALKEAGPAPQSVISLELRVRDAEKLPQALDLKNLHLFFSINKQGPYLTAIEKDRGDKILVRRDHACKAEGIISPDSV